jgi:hypothetical protein
MPRGVSVMIDEIRRQSLVRAEAVVDRRLSIRVALMVIIGKHWIPWP